MSDFSRQWAKEIKEAKSGKIHMAPYWGWVLGEKPAVNPQGVVLRASRDQDGQMMTLKKGRYTNQCPLPPEPSPRLTSGHSVRQSACRKCPHYIQGGYCAELRRLNSDAGLKALRLISETVSEMKIGNRE